MRPLAMNDQAARLIPAVTPIHIPPPRLTGQGLVFFSSHRILTGPSGLINLA